MEQSYAKLDQASGVVVRNLYQFPFPPFPTGPCVHKLGRVTRNLVT
jgi:hypothetical protein